MTTLKEIISQPWEQYKADFATPVFFKREAYKWIVLNQVYAKWDWDNAEDKAAMFANAFEVKGDKNLWASRHYYPVTMYKEMLEAFPEKAVAALGGLFNENKALTDRIKMFLTEIEEMRSALDEQSPGINKSNHYHSDLRAVSLYLSLQLPDKYLIYKSSTFREFLRLTALDSGSPDKFAAFTAYLELAENIRNFLITDEQFIARYQTFASQKENYNDPHLYLLVQDFIFSIVHYFGQSFSSFWIFQGNPKIYNVVDSLKDNALKSWSVSAHKDKIKIGDKIILWLTGEKSGCYALGRVTSGIANRLDDDIEQKYYTDSSKLQSTDRVQIAIEHNLWNNPVLKEVLIDLPEFQDFNGGNQGTNFAASQLHYETILKHINMIGSNHFPLNQIFFGPPGTGKTYKTSSEAIRIADPDFYKANEKDREKLKQRFRELLIKDWKNPQKGQISFCTFHQSFSYEDFIEGIKPVVEKQEETIDGVAGLKYNVEAGIFKKMARRARYFASGEAHKDKLRLNLSDTGFMQAQFYKLSLGERSMPDYKGIYEYCIKNSLVSIGFMDGLNLAELGEAEIYKLAEKEKLSKNESQALSLFIHYLKKDNYVVILEDNVRVSALGRVTGDYFYKKDAPIRHNHFRSVEWIIKDADIPVEEIYTQPFSQQTIYKLNKDWVNKEFFVQQPASAHKEELPNFVLIIDEINRGNISQIFGELITLIEDDKREGKPEQLEVTLPYSKEKFSVPANLHIIGTMNTADRSIEALDTALRRRFTFVEMAPDPELIITVGKSKGEIDGIDLVKLLTTINERIEKLIDKDHRIGHSYFLDIQDLYGLRFTFKNKIVPLLEEYFFGDMGKIGLVLGEACVVAKETKSFNFAKFNGFDQDIITDLKERRVFFITDPDRWETSDFISIYK